MTPPISRGNAQRIVQVKPNDKWICMRILFGASVLDPGKEKKYHRNLMDAIQETHMQDWHPCASRPRPKGQSFVQSTEGQVTTVGSLHSPEQRTSFKSMRQNSAYSWPFQMLIQREIPKSSAEIFLAILKVFCCTESLTGLFGQTENKYSNGRGPRGDRPFT